MTHCSNCQ